MPCTSFPGSYMEKSLSISGSIWLVRRTPIQGSISISAVVDSEQLRVRHIH